MKRHFYSLLMLMVVIFGGFTYYSHTSILRNAEESLETSMESLGTTIFDRLQTIDKLYYLLEEQADREMRVILEKMKADYDQTGILPDALEAYAREDPFLDTYVIDRSLKVIRSTEKKDLGLDFSKYEKLSAQLYAIFDEGLYASDRINRGTVTKTIRKYSYLPSADKQYLFEASVDMAKYYRILGNDGIEHFGSDLIRDREEVLSINLLNLSGRSYNNPELSLKELENPTRYEMNKKAFQTETPQKLEISESSIKKVYLYYPHKIASILDNHLNVGLEIQYTNAAIIREARTKLYRQIFSFLLFIFFIAAIFLYANANYLRPLNTILQAINRIRGKELDFSVNIKTNNEMQIMGDSFNEMIQSLNQLIQEKEGAHLRLEEALRTNEHLYFETTRALANAIEAKDLYTGGHCERVMNLSALLAEELALSEATKNDLKFGSLLHDIGKIGIKDEILNKPGAYTPEEYQVIQKHPEIGFKIVENILFLGSAREIILHHHEKVDGSGYPGKLSGEEIPLEARILAIVDAFDAMTSERIYRTSRFTVQQAFEEMNRCTGSHFDPNLAAAFNTAYRRRFGNDLDRFSEELES